MQPGDRYTDRYPDAGPFAAEQEAVAAMVGRGAAHAPQPVLRALLVAKQLGNGLSQQLGAIKLAEALGHRVDIDDPATDRVYKEEGVARFVKQGTSEVGRRHGFACWDML